MAVEFPAPAELVVEIRAAARALPKTPLQSSIQVRKYLAEWMKSLRPGGNLHDSFAEASTFYNRENGARAMTYSSYRLEYFGRREVSNPKGAR